MNIVFVDDEFSDVDGVRTVDASSVAAYLGSRRRELLDFYLRALIERGHSVSLIKSPSVAIKYFAVARPEVHAMVLDLQMPVEDLPWSDQYTTGMLVLRRVLEFQTLPGMRPQPLPVAVLTNLSDDRIFQKLKEDNGEAFPRWLWISKKSGGTKSPVTATAWVMNLETWLLEGKVIVGTGT